MVAATGVIVAAIFYMLNLRETTRNRRITLTTTLMEPFSTKEGLRDFVELVSMQWSDLEDFKKRYDSRVNPENYALRQSMWIKCDKLGQLYNDGLLDLRTLDIGSGSVIQYMWTKFKPVIEMYRKTDFTPLAYRDFESVAEKLLEYDQVKGDLEKGRLGRIMQEQADAMHAKTP
jgi:hypothetical protein